MKKNSVENGSASLADAPPAVSASLGALRAARALRVKIHDMNGRKGSVTHPENTANAKWLDSVTPDDARIIDRHTATADLLEALKLFVDRMDRWGDEDEGVFYYGGKCASELQLPIRMARVAIEKAEGR